MIKKNVWLLTKGIYLLLISLHLLKIIEIDYFNDGLVFTLLIFSVIVYECIQLILLYRKSKISYIFVSIEMFIIVTLFFSLSLDGFPLSKFFNVSYLETLSLNNANKIPLYFRFHKIIEDINGVDINGVDILMFLAWIFLPILCSICLAFLCPHLNPNYKKKINIWYILMPIVPFLFISQFTFRWQPPVAPGLSLVACIVNLCLPGYIYVFSHLYRHQQSITSLKKVWIIVSLVILLIISLYGILLSFFVISISPFIICSFFCILHMLILISRMRIS